MGRGKNGRGAPNRGGGFRGGNGNSRGRGRGRGTPDSGRGRGRGTYVSMDEIDFQIQQYSEEPAYSNDGPKRGSNTPRPRGRGGRGGNTTPRGTNSPRGRGQGNSRSQTPIYHDSPRRGRGEPSPFGTQRGRRSNKFPSKLGGNISLSKLLYEDRPFLKPVIFVRSERTATLFQEEEDILKAAVEEPEADESHVPTADKVSRIFNEAAEEEAGEVEEELEEIDFSEVGRIQAEVDAVAATVPNGSNGDVAVVEERFTGFFIDPNPASASVEQTTRSHLLGNISGIPEADDEEIVYVAPHPRAGPVTPTEERAIFESLPTTSILTGLTPSLEPPEIIVPSTASTVDAVAYSMAKSGATEMAATSSEKDEPMELFIIDSTPSAVSNIEAVEPSTGIFQDSEVVAVEESVLSTDIPEKSSTAMEEEITPVVVPAPAFESFSFQRLFSTPSKLERKANPVKTPRSLLNRSRSIRSARKLHHFGSYGALLSEAHLQEEASGIKKDPRRNEQRRGDSDVDWGDGSDGDEGVEEISNRMGEMEIDEELDLKAMARFAQSMSAEGSRFVSMDDIEDVKRIQWEDEGDDDESVDSSEEDEEQEAVVRKEERSLVGEEEYVEDDSEDSSDDEDASGSFQARLARIREADKGKQRADAEFDDGENEDDDLEMTLEMSWADQDEKFLAHIQTFVDEGQDILTRKERKQKARIFNAIRDGNWKYDDYEELVSRPAKRGKNKDIPPELQDQWEKDRQKKAENKRKRALARLEAAADPLAQKNGGKKGMKATLAAARYEGELPNRVNDLISLERQIRRFLADIGGPQTMALPPAKKDTRKKVHELATAFNLKSQSKGPEHNRYITLIKTTRSGIAINEKKVGRVLRSVDPAWEGPDRNGRAKVSSLAKHKEGEEVGKAAPKIGQSNVGFQMLAAMGWSEGDRIGLSGGLDVPLVAVMKKTKLGLGATVL